MNFKKYIMLLLVIVFLFSCVPVSALENDGSLDEAVLSEKLSNIKFKDGNAIVMGSLTDNLSVDKLLVNVSDDFITEYNIDSINVKDGEEILSSDSVVVSDMILFISLKDDSSMEFTIKVVGDLNSDGIVNNDDMELMIDGIIATKEEEQDEEVDVISDVNEDESVDVTDVTQLAYSIGESNWGIGQVELNDIVSSLGADDVIFVDDTVEVIYKITGLNAGKFKGVSGILNYDKSILELDSVLVDSMYGRLNEDGNFFYLFDENTEEVIITFSFKVNDKGDGNTTVSLDDLKAAIDGVSVELDETSLSKGMQIDEYGKGGDTAPEEENTIPEEVVSTPVTNVVHNTYTNYEVSYVALSSNNYIKSLDIKNYKIDFDRDTLEYTITVGNKVDSLNLFVILEDTSASFEIIGNENFKVGKNVVTIKVTAEDGSVRNYIINVNKKGEAPIKENKNYSKFVVVGLIVLIIAGLVYVIFNDDEEEDSKK